MSTDYIKINIIKRGETPVPSSYEEIKKMYIRPDPEKSLVKEFLYTICLGSSDGYPGFAHCICCCAFLGSIIYM